MLVASIFSFFHNVFNPMKDKCIFSFPIMFSKVFGFFPPSLVALKVFTLWYRLNTFANIVDSVQLAQGKLGFGFGHVSACPNTVLFPYPFVTTRPIPYLRLTHSSELG